MYLHTILQRPETEIVRKVFTEQRNNPCKGDWVTLVEADLKELGMDFEQISRCSEDVFRQQISKKIRDKAFIELKQIQKWHEKVRYILFTQNYMSIPLFTIKLKSLLFYLRCRSVKNIKDNVHKHYTEDLFCPLSCENTLDTQEHLLACIGMKKHLSIKQLELLANTQYEHLFALGTPWTIDGWREGRDDQGYKLPKKGKGDRARQEVGPKEAPKGATGQPPPNRCELCNVWWRTF